jgi:hypothetical protein
MHLESSLALFSPLAPVLIALLGAILSLRLGRRRSVHLAAFAAMISALPAFLRTQARLDWTIQYPGLGDGFILVLLLCATRVPDPGSSTQFFAKQAVAEEHPLPRANELT